MNTELEDKVLRMVVEIIDQLDFLSWAAKQEIINQINFGWQGEKLRKLLEKYPVTQKENCRKEVIQEIIINLQDMLKREEKGGEKDE